MARTTLGRALALLLSFAGCPGGGTRGKGGPAKSREDKVAPFQKALHTPKAERQAHVIGLR